jgi:hypothetical protein
MEFIAYCMKCKTKRTVKNPKEITHSNGRKAVTGTCANCGTKIFRMGAMPGPAVAKETPKAPAKGKTAAKK